MEAEEKLLEALRKKKPCASAVLNKKNLTPREMDELFAHE